MAAKPRSAQISKTQILAIIASIEFACTILSALIPILKQLIGRFEELEK